MGDLLLDMWNSFKVIDLINSNALQIGDGYRAKISEFSKQGLPFVRASDVNKEINLNAADCIDMNHLRKAGNKISEPFDVVFTSKGTVGRFALVKQDTQRFVYSPQLCYWRVKNNKLIYPLFLYYCMQGCEFQKKINCVKSQTDMADYVSLQDQKNMDIKLPPLNEQRAIAHILGTLDDKIELNRKMNETLEAMAKAIFKSWFVDFDPVRAKMEGREPAGMDAETAALFPDGFEESELGEIPRGWRVGRLREIAKVNAESINKDYSYEIVEYIDISSVSVGKLLETSQYWLKEAPSRARRLVKHGDTIWSMVRPNRKSYLYMCKPKENIVVSTGFAVLSSINETPCYLYAWVTTENFVEYLTNSADGSAYPAVLSNVFENALIIIPENRVVRIYEKRINNLREKIAYNDDESRTLAQIRDALLPKLLSGEIRVGEAEKVVESAV